MGKPVKQITIVKNWGWPDLRRQTPNGDGVWEGLHFSIDTAAPCDVLVVLNNQLSVPFTTTVSGNNCWALMQEPYAKGVTDWMVEKHAVFDRVFSNCIPSADDKYVRCVRGGPEEICHTNLQGYQECDRMDGRSWAGIVLLLLFPPRPEALRCADRRDGRDCLLTTGRHQMLEVQVNGIITKL